GFAPKSELDQQLSGAGQGEHVRVLETERLRFRTVHARGEDLWPERSFPGCSVDDSLPVGSEPGGIDGPTAKSQLPELWTRRSPDRCAGDDAHDAGRGNERKQDERRAPSPHRRGPRAQRMQRRLLQIEREILSGLVTPFPILLQTAPNNPVDLQRDLRGEVGRVVVQDCRPRLNRRLPLEGTLSGEHLVEDGSRAEDVRTMIGLAAAHLLRGHVLDGSEDWPDVGARRRKLHFTLWRHKPGSGQSGEAEVENLQPSLVRDEE